MHVFFEDILCFFYKNLHYKSVNHMGTSSTLAHWKTGKIQTLRCEYAVQPQLKSSIYQYTEKGKEKKREENQRILCVRMLATGEISITDHSDENLNGQPIE